MSTVPERSSEELPREGPEDYSPMKANMGLVENSTSVPQWAREKHRAKKRAYDQSRDPIKIKARNRLRHEIEEGRLQRRPCEKCGKPNAHAHHEDYSKPLEVKWLCPKHHRELHDAKR